MSTVERNKGRLIPVTLEDWIKYFPEASCEDLEWDTKGNYVRIGDDFYKIVWEIKKELDCSDFADVVENIDGSINFHTLHYNGGAHWTEVIEQALTKKENPFEFSNACSPDSAEQHCCAK